MAFENYTIKDIAKALNLSTSTVSRALRDSYEISAETKKLVLAYAEKINYRANPIARSLKERKSYSIGIIVSEIANNFFSQVIDGIESVAYAKNYQVVISQTHESSERERLNVEHLYSRSTDGLLMALSAETIDSSYLEELMKKGFPIVFFDRVPGQIKSHKVIADNRQGGFEAVQYLAKKGRRKIAHLTGAKKLSITAERLEGYKMALLANGLDFSPALVKYCEYGGLHQAEIEKAVAELAEEDYDAIFISGDKLTTGYLQAMKDRPEADVNSILIAGFTNSKVVNIFSPTITAIRQPAFEMGKKAAELLIQQIESKYAVDEFETIVLPTTLIERE
ncbi:LacI family transcriptional regulator [Sphingobacterium allocomposti]|jgi:LacI family transcriptional regulator|uniref:LacI family transcriptional regulator n=1 Tax=Sphingobacterium allocomposti TaxID=415956 RepID=A0A5S5D522_9SPHI|nr:LacI family DNA-binding transcriptional regulator [Sphingobacterium composti Yoo et al. 2007 non Ten et al. 2007]TYP90266.1 LacI family transcriptional regulator [Sphingobacterium composti Yoo et al. 2007 non Ten et al. 2007]HLS95576.1 LacI family DNA-binding transcriptional regulator [Sphingobacterium sp.]